MFAVSTSDIEGSGPVDRLPFDNGEDVGVTDWALVEDDGD
jgi:hypothetical protein